MKLCDDTNVRQNFDFLLKNYLVPSEQEYVLIQGCWICWNFAIINYSSTGIVHVIIIFAKKKRYDWQARNTKLSYMRLELCFCTNKLLLRLLVDSRFKMTKNHFCMYLLSNLSHCTVRLLVYEFSKRNASLLVYSGLLVYQGLQSNKVVGP